MLIRSDLRKNNITKPIHVKKSQMQLAQSASSERYVIGSYIKYAFP